MDQYVGEIRMFGGNFAPDGWLFCNGQQLNISQYEVLFTVIGTTYGGDGVNTFALPDLRGRIPMNRGTGSSGTPYSLGQMGGTENVTLTPNQIAQHTHAVMVSPGNGEAASPANAVWAGSTVNQYSTGTPNANMAGQTVSFTGGNGPHDNMMPYLAVSFIIATNGLFPTQS
ncbi:phage tail protein [Cohnella pontilimi]|uniref:Phage tail protein n=1 Tax=Cohnella pontilimi TaxID=2564100 RepID=A0A4U0FD02_9BACL|nr:tail fiber protein [Cohnella pontilimi]TJY42786.1 phage tail protein [Cohnella pontilimi]